MQIRVKEFNQEDFENSVARVLSKLNLEDKRVIRNILIAVNDAIEDALELQKKLDSISLEQPKRVPQPQPKEPIVEKEEVVDEKQVFEDSVFEVDESENDFVQKKRKWNKLWFWVLKK